MCVINIKKKKVLGVGYFAKSIDNDNQNLLTLFLYIQKKKYSIISKIYSRFFISKNKCPKM